ncbi:MAG: NRDE family protein [Actinomycetota bacterium]|nr:NRDE family protein [Actinomycetota bacterium]MDQ2955793.1 NRDE family protein [Actinomycetota bacterium]
MCTVICRWSPDRSMPIRLLALRDELTSRAFDLPSAWWPDQPQVVGGLDRVGGGSWCASDVGAGVTAVVLNRGERMRAEPGAPSRGVLPLLAVQEHERWPEAIELAGMASFNLVLARPDGLRWWSYDGSTLGGAELDPGTHLFTPRGLADNSLDSRFLNSNLPLEAGEKSTEAAWPGWLQVLQESVPSTDPLALLVKIPLGDEVFETVFGQFIAARPGSLRLDYVRTPSLGLPWTTARWQLHDEVATLDR